MPINENQLQIWSNQGAISISKDTHEAIRSAISKHNFPDHVQYDLYLQGSYKNSTNIYGDSDVDLVVELTSTILQNTSSLSAREAELFQQLKLPAQYTWDQFHSDIQRTLKLNLGANLVTPGKKAIKLKKISGRVDADVIVCLRHKYFKRFYGWDDYQCINGIAIWVPAEQRWVVNYPKDHYDNGVDFHSTTNERYKPTVRMFKNARNRAVDLGRLNPKDAPSYFIEGFLSNIPETYFVDSKFQTFLNCLKVAANSDFDTFMCLNKKQKLFGVLPEQWSKDSARKFCIAMCDLLDS